MFKDSVSSFASGFDSCRRHLSLLFKLVPHGHIHPPPQLSNSDVQYRTWFSRLANSSVVVFNWISRLFANSFMRRTASWLSTSWRSFGIWNVDKWLIGREVICRAVVELTQKKRI
jgi:hypothetical protein